MQDLWEKRCKRFKEKKRKRKQLLLRNKNKIPSQIYYILVNNVMPFLQIGKDITLYKTHPK
jgi:hypothetical protein